MKLFIFVVTIFLALFAVINAGPVKELDQVNGRLRVRREDCNLRECNDSCKRIFLPGGVCVRNKCKCDIL
ncbi:unnamed protein product [Pieris macdunnoughi]|uniref:Uncharacterized protein n=1 Tax=Pieris macdunnoughi TaxID=345717 RepID=A0A821UTV4_9NEOP|nr:unnamed protein product [Pieris macdunnoughi]